MAKLRSPKNSPRAKNTVFDIQRHAGPAWARYRKTIYLRRHFYRRHPLATSFGALALVLVSVFAFDAFLGHANTVYWYPKSCLGGWTNPANAAGAPELAPGAASDEFTADNSAILDNSISQMFCGEFGGDIPEKAMPTSVTLDLSLAFKVLPAPGAITQSDPVVSSTGSEPGPAATTPAAEESPPADTPADAPAPEPVPVEEVPAPKTSLWRFVPVALAQEEAVVPEETPAPTEETPPTSTAETSPEPSSTEAIPAPEVLPAPPASTDLLEVLYSIDGQTWQSLGKIGESGWQEARFAIPLTAWEDLKNLQISVTSLSVADIAPIVYLDGMSLEVGYDLLPSTEPEIDRGTDETAGGFVIPEPTSSAPLALTLSVSDDGQGNQALEASTTPGAILWFYKIGTPEFSITVPVGDQPIQMPIYQFSVGRFVLVAVGPGEDCTGFSIEECRARPGYIGERPFSTELPTSTASAVIE